MTKTELKRVCVKPYDKDRFEVIQDYEFILPNYKGVVPQGFKTDGASIPPFFGLCFHLLKVSILGLCVHDFLWKKQIKKITNLLILF